MLLRGVGGVVMPIITITSEEGWSCHRYARQTDKLGVEHDKEQQQRLHAGSFMPLFYQKECADACHRVHPE